MGSRLVSSEGVGGAEGLVYSKQRVNTISEVRSEWEKDSLKSGWVSFLSPFEIP